MLTSVWEELRNVLATCVCIKKFVIALVANTEYEQLCNDILS